MCIENGSEYCSMKHKLILPLVRGVCLLLVMVGIVDNVIGQGSPYIATSQNYFCAGSANEVSMYCNVLAFDPGTNVADWEFFLEPIFRGQRPDSPVCDCGTGQHNRLFRSYDSSGWYRV